MKLRWLGLALAFGCQVVSGLGRFKPSEGSGGAASAASASGVGGACCSGADCASRCLQHCLACKLPGCSDAACCQMVCDAAGVKDNPACICALAPGACSPSDVPAACKTPGAGGASSTGAGMPCCSDAPSCQKRCQEFCGACAADPQMAMPCYEGCQAKYMKGTLGACVCAAAQNKCTPLPPDNCP